MLQFIKNLFGMGQKTDFAQLLKEGGQIIDVRTKAEYQGGHIKGSINIPLQELTNHLNKIKKDKPVITCCASGMRSASAKSILQSKGYQNVYNGGGWTSLKSKI